MPYLFGFIIALFIALTGVGAGTITVPVLMLFLGVPAPVAVGIGLTFSAIVKLLLAPAQIARRQVSWPTLGYMLMGGVPGVAIGTLLLDRFVTAGSNTLLDALLGVVLMATASTQIFFSLRPERRLAQRKDRRFLLAWLMLPVGAEVGFSSAGAGALGSAALLALTPLDAAEVVGTDIVFGALLSLLGALAHGLVHGLLPGLAHGAYASSGLSGFSLHQPLLLPMVAGGLAGALAGLLLSGRVPRRPMRFALWLWILVLGGQLVMHSYNARNLPANKEHTTLALSADARGLRQEFGEFTR